MHYGRIFLLSPHRIASHLKDCVVFFSSIHILLLTFASMLLDRLGVLTLIWGLKSCLPPVILLSLFFNYVLRASISFVHGIRQLGADICKVRIKLRALFGGPYTSNCVCFTYTKKMWWIHGEFTKCELGPKQTSFYERGVFLSPLPLDISEQQILLWEVFSSKTRMHFFLWPVSAASWKLCGL